jgi:hypothetical protein
MTMVVSKFFTSFVKAVEAAAAVGLRPSPDPDTELGAPQTQTPVEKIEK